MYDRWYFLMSQSIYFTEVRLTITWSQCRTALNEVVQCSRHVPISKIWLLSPRRQGSFSAGFFGFARFKKLEPVFYYTRKNAQVVTGLQTSCYKSVHKLSASCVRTVCSHVVATSFEQAVNNL